ncbi:phosphomethylpyrimidine synthase ThiC [Treponema sp.]|uniref:phosphomethylpyrimidine synthase ThiC n=1 Tax=Treponema sp. TaxID=166 RepID=UPI00298D81BD|nr:phosphomethylpyrimidine synthase ThiC [Treponema sp.]MCQ2241779.1 phosphomethylpyrimidine synthase ThiC [Treponema sp.]
MEQYTTQMDAAKRGIVTEQMKIVAAKEKMSVEELMPLVATGKVAICANKHHKCLDPEGVGSMLRTKINVNLGISRDCKDYDVEMAKVNAAVEMGAEAIMDLSSHGDTIPFRRKLTSECKAMIGTVPVYDSVIHYKRDLATLTAKDFIDVVRLHAEDGVDFVTLHCGITRHTIDQIKKHKRKMNIVSRGGSLVFAWMTMTGNENPFYEYYDEILEICREHDVTISLGDACRPGCLADASDVCQIEELVRLGELTKRAWAKDVQVMVEGPGHMPMDQIAANMKIQQTICMGAPFYVLGPLVTDIAPGYDHITSAIGGAIAAQNGAAFLCYVTPAEHLALPNVDDVKQGIIASKIAAHAADIAKGVRGAMDIDNKMADARRRLDWDAQWECALDPETAKAIRDSRAPEHDDTCSMCGKFCAVRSMNKALAGEHVDIL